MKNHNTTKVLFAALASCVFSLISACSVLAQPVNIALDKTVTFGTNPNYWLSTDPDDKLQLTDGKYSSEGKLAVAENTTAIWSQKGTVGWAAVKPVIITIDLGSVQPISGVSYSTAAGVSDVTFPSAIYVATSDDNENWHYTGELIALSKKNGLPPEKGYNTFRFITNDLKTKGRYISFGVISTYYTFVDEIEVYKGEDAWLAQPIHERAVAGMTNLVNEIIVTAHARRRLNNDIAAIRANVKQSNLPANSKSTFAMRLDKAADATVQMQPLSADTQTILPLGDIHQDILAVHGEVLAAQGFKPLTVWKQHRYAWLPLLAKPQATEKAQLDISMLRNQFRSDNLLLTNSSGQSQQTTLQLNNPPHGAMDGWLQVYSVAWTDTEQGTPVADALMPISQVDGKYTVKIPAGMTRKVWFTVDSTKVPAGASKSTFTVNGVGQQITVPFNLDISKVAMGRPRLALGMWDYTNGNGADGINPQNRQAAIDLMRSHYVDTPWATGAALPRPGAIDFDAQNNLKVKPDFSNLDNWIAMWPEARHYFVYPAVGDSFAGAKMGTPEFDARVGSWAKVLADHMRELGKKPEQLGLLLVDEPRSDEQDAIIVAWAHAINATAPELTLFEDNNWVHPDQAKNQEAFTDVDILSPQLPVLQQGGESAKKFYENLRLQGKELWLYQCTGPVRTYDPQSYYRHQAWQAFSIGATGSQFWAFGDTGGAPTSWNAYTTKHSDFAPAFIDKDTVYNSVHWDAVREGIEDYEELAMLRDAINASNNATWKQQAQQVLDDAVKAVTDSWTGDYGWTKASDANLADAHLHNVRGLLDNQIPPKR